MMIERLEEVLKRSLEQPFARLFPGTLHPLEIASELRDAARAGRLQTPGGTFVPNAYVVHLAEADAEKLAGIADTVCAELVDHVVSYAAGEGWHAGPYVGVVLQPDGQLGQSLMRIEADFAPCPGTAWLSVEAGVAGRQRYEVGDRAEIGRSKSCDIAIASPEVSRHHCRIAYSYVEYCVEDLGSANGTFVNAERIEKAVLGDGDLIEIGLVQLRFHTE